MGLQSAATGLFTIMFTMFFGANFLRRVTWFKAAVFTPMLILTGGVLFFLFILAKDQLGTILAGAGLDAVTAATFLGVTVVVLSKSVKYSLFDPTKEMAYIPLDDELKVKGKAAVDVIGGRAGKAGGSAVQSALTMAMVTKDVVAIAPVAFGTFAVVCALWLVAVKNLSKRYETALAKFQKKSA